MDKLKKQEVSKAWRFNCTIGVIFILSLLIGVDSWVWIVDEIETMYGVVAAALMHYVGGVACFLGIAAVVSRFVLRSVSCPACNEKIKYQGPLYSVFQHGRCPKCNQEIVETEDQ